MFMPENFFEYAVSIGASKEILELLFEANQNETRDEQVSFDQACLFGHYSCRTFVCYPPIQGCLHSHDHLK